MMLTLSIAIILLSGYALAAPFHEAAKEGNLTEVKRLIEEGADLNVIDEYGSTPLHFTADLGHKDLVGLLFSKGANVNAVCSFGGTPLGTARSKGWWLDMIPKVDP